MSVQPQPVYVPPDKTVRIAATYAAPTPAEIVPEGHPETVEIELTGNAIPDTAAELTVFVDTLVDSLFRTKSTGVELAFNLPESTPSAVAEADRHAVAARGGSR